MRNHRLTSIIPMLIILSLIISSTTYGEETKLNVVYTDWFPYTYQEDETSHGFEIEIFKAVMEKMNMKADFKIYPWKRCLEYLQNGKADALISMLKTPEREKYAYYPDENISVSKTMFFTTIDKNIKFSGAYEELKGYSIGVIRGFSYGEAFEKAVFLKKDEAKDAKTLITKLVNGRTDLAAENQAVISGNALKMGVKDKIRFIAPPIHTKKLYVGFSKINKRAKLSDDFSTSLGEFKNSEQYKTILEKYGINYSEMTDAEK